MIRMYNRFDLHVYSKYSSFAINEPRTIVKKAIQKGLKGFAITDLNSIKSWSFLNTLCKENNLVFVPGQEINLYYKSKYVGKSVALFTLDKIECQDIFDVLDEVKSQGALLSISHPFDFHRKFRAFDIISKRNQFTPISRKLRCIETFNSRSLSLRSSIKAKKFAKEHNLIETAGSSAHLPYEIGMGYVKCNATNQGELLKLLKERKVETDGKISGIVPRLHTLGNRLNIIKDKHFN